MKAAPEGAEEIMVRGPCREGIVPGLDLVSPTCEIGYPRERGAGGQDVCPGQGVHYTFKGGAARNFYTAFSLICQRVRAEDESVSGHAGRQAEKEQEQKEKAN